MSGTTSESATAPAIRYAIYTRQSVAKSGDPFGSCAAQFSVCQDFVAARAAPSWQWIGTRFDDVGISGTAERRPGLDLLMQRVAAGEIQKVVVYKMDRLARTLRRIVTIADSIRRHGAELLVLNAPKVADDASDNMVFNLMATVAEFEWSMIRSRVLDSIAARKQRRLRLAGAIPYGYGTDPRTRQLVPDPVESGRAAAIFQLALDGMPPADIAISINEQGWRTKAHTSQRSGQRNGGSRWTPRQILTLLRNPTVLGLFRDGQGTRPGNHRPIVAREVFDQVQDRIAERRTGLRPGSRSPGNSCVLRGRIACPSCGRFLSPHLCTVKMGRRTARTRAHYRCRSHAGGRPPCRGTGLPAYEVESTVIEVLGEDDLPSRCTPTLRCDVLRFQSLWATTSLHEQRRWLSRAWSSG
jgi:site-specific DNA recombinase